MSGIFITAAYPQPTVSNHLRFDMALHIINGIKIHTSHDYPPIPVRNMDWSAVTDDYDCDCDQDGFFSTSPAGRGATEESAIADLLEQIEERSK